MEVGGCPGLASRLVQTSQCCGVGKVCWQSSGTHRKLKTGMPLSGWRQKASGVSSTSTVRARSRPSLDKSLMHGYLCVHEASAVV